MIYLLFIINHKAVAVCYSPWARLLMVTELLIWTTVSRMLGTIPRRKELNITRMQVSSVLTYTCLQLCSVHLSSQHCYCVASYSYQYHFTKWKCVVLKIDSKINQIFASFDKIIRTWQWTFFLWLDCWTFDAMLSLNVSVNQLVNKERRDWSGRNLLVCHLGFHLTLCLHFKTYKSTLWFMDYFTKWHVLKKDKMV